MASQKQYGQEEDPNEDRPQQTKIAKDNKVDYRAKKTILILSTGYALKIFHDY